MKTYNQFAQAGVNEIDLDLTLYFEGCEMQANLVTDSREVHAKMRILHCFIEELYKDQGETKIYYQDVNDKLFGFLN